MSEATNNLYGAMRYLLMHKSQLTDPPSSAPRGVVSKQDALDALMQVAARIDAAFEGVELEVDHWLAAGAALMVVQEFIEPLPPAVGPDGRDLVAEGLGEYLTAFRSWHAPDHLPPDLT